MKNYNILFLLVLVLFCRNAAFAQDKKVISLYGGKAPSSENWNWKEKDYKMGRLEFAMNVTDPTLTIYLPEKEKSNGKAVVICPGGAFHMLSMTGEGDDIAKWMNDKGYAAFVLKYRLGHLKTNDAAEIEELKKNNQFDDAVNKILPFAIEDGKNAIAYVRQHAAEYNIQPNNIGILGFSAGGTVAIGVALTYSVKEKPNFVAAVYPASDYVLQNPLPSDAPPIFITASSDVEFDLHKASIQLYSKWNDGKKSAELHIYRNGGHGFGIKKRMKVTSTWIDRFNDWIEYL